MGSGGSLTLESLGRGSCGDRFAAHVDSIPPREPVEAGESRGGAGQSGGVAAEAETGAEEGYEKHGGFWEE